MKFPNAYAGVKKIFTSEVLSIIAAICLLVALILGIVAAGSGANALINESGSAANATLGSLIGAVVLIAAFGVLTIIAYILQIVGISKAAKDEPAFKTALIFVIIGAACAVAYAFTKNNSDAAIVASISSTLQRVSNLGVSVYIIQGIRNLADRLNNGAISAKGGTIFKLILVFYGIIIIANIVAIFSVTIAAILGIVSAVLDLIVYIIFIGLLSNAKKMLA